MHPTLQPHGLKHTRLPCPSLYPRVCSNSCALSWWCHPTISSSVAPFCCLQPFPTSESFPVSPFFTSGGKSIWASASASVLPMNIQVWVPLGFTSLISCSPRDSQQSSPAPQFESISSLALTFFMVQLSHPYMIIGKRHSFDYMTFVSFWFLHQIWMKSLLGRVFFHPFKYLMTFFPGLQSFYWKISWEPCETSFVFFSLLLLVFSLEFLSFLITVCLGVFLFGLILFGTLYLPEFERLFPFPG